MDGASSADTKEVKAIGSPSQVRWVYARDRDLVTLAVTEDRGGFTLHRHGPDVHESTQWCADSWVLSDALLALEAHLLALGYALEQSTGPIGRGGSSDPPPASD